MLWEVTFTKQIEAEDFFDAVDVAKQQQNDESEVISVCPAYIEEDYIP